ncbi:Cation/H+ exchanger [Corchorus olitorius]|uniref:Cation/H+ exchanger n=1 Tax=Corchorus olitorius TaxID=93759 RepID=A0A1R3KTI3_9ROSI|nr:Cation/H+ exchanger [Corchorus olitorius]
MHRSPNRAGAYGILFDNRFEVSPDKDLIRNKNFFLSVTYSGTSFPVIHGLLSELKILNSELGRLGLSAALVSDLLSQLLVIIGQWLRKVADEGAILSVVEDIGLTIAFVVIVFLVLRPGMKWMVRRTPQGGQINDVFVNAVILVFMLTPAITSIFRVFIVMGPFLLGLAVPDGPPLGSTLVEKLDPLVSGLFLPLFASTCGMRIEMLHLLRSNEYAKTQVIAALVTLIVKFLVSLGLPLLWKMPTRDSFALAFIMITKGVVEMGTYSLLFDNKIISGDLFSIMSIIIVLLASIVPLFVNVLYDPAKKYIGYKERSIYHSKLNEELRMISCIHAPGNVNSIINILNISSPTKETPIALNVLHMVKLSGRATPLFIDHKNHNETLCSESYSDNIVLAFNKFKRDNSEAVTLNVFTAVSPPNLMYGDICNLAMDKLSSFIILPFHRTWNVDGSIESEDQAIRNLNCNILDRAPCSVGILVEGHRKSIATFSSSSLPSGIAVIFLGDSDGMLDDEMLKIMRETRYIRYIEQQVHDGPESSSYLRNVANDYQLIIVGRRYNMEDPRTNGLEEWCEFPEIGIIGDMVSSTDFGGIYSVLIVQQQQLEVS